MVRIVAVVQRELRLDDNPLFEGADRHEIIPLFILDDAVRRDLNATLTRLLFYGVQQLGQSIADHGGRLYCVHHEQEEAFFSLARPDLVRLCDAVTARGRERNARLVRLLGHLGIPFQILRDYTLTPIPDQPYTTFTRFYKRHFLPSIRSGIPSYPAPRGFKTPALPITEAVLPTVSAPGAEGWLRTESAVLQAWETFVRQHLPVYGELLDIPSAGATSRMSPYVRCGLISLGRMLRDALDVSEAFVRSLARHDYFAQLLVHFPWTADQPLDEAWRRFPWQHDRQALRRWQEGETGFPLVDAGMRQLRQEGWMDNRIRMVVASFLTRHLRLDWRWGVDTFARCLVDADLAQNVGNWQWVTGCGGPDSTHYFRVRNPLVQARRFDPDGLYTRRYVPELRDVPAVALTRLDRLHQAAPGYPAPIVDLAAARREFVQVARGVIRQARTA